jgi:hypothetical protein
MQLNLHTYVIKFIYVCNDALHTYVIFTAYVCNFSGELFAFFKVNMFKLLSQFRTWNKENTGA